MGDWWGFFVTLHIYKFSLSYMLNIKDAFAMAQNFYISLYRVYYDLMFFAQYLAFWKKNNLLSSLNLFPYLFQFYYPLAFQAKGVLSLPASVCPWAEHIYDLITGTFQKRNAPDHDLEQLNGAIITAQKIIPQMNKAELKKIGGMAHEDTIKDCNIPLRLLHIIIDLTAAKLHVKTDEKPQASKKKIEHAFTIKYVNHWIDKLRLGNILHDPVLEETLPICVKDKGLPTVVYKYQHTVRGQLFNYNGKSSFWSWSKREESPWRRKSNADQWKKCWKTPTVWKNWRDLKNSLCLFPSTRQLTTLDLYVRNTF